MPEKPLNTVDLLARARRADREALDALFSEAYPNLLQAARFRIGPALRARMDTLDLAQTAYHEALRDLPKYRYRGKGSFLRWLLTILENKIRNRLDFFKARRRDMRRDVPLEAGGVVHSPAVSPTVKLVQEEDKARLEAAMDQLEEAYREVIVCRYYLGMAWEEIGAHLNRSAEAAQMLCKRALLKMKKLYGSMEGQAG